MRIGSHGTVLPTFFKTNSIFAGDIGIKVNPDAHIILAPNIGSYVGGDITAGAFVTMLWNQEPFSLFIDLGTNGEIVFGNSDFMFSCACSAGPAFEGGDISCGMQSDRRCDRGMYDRCRNDGAEADDRWQEAQNRLVFCGSGI